MGVTSLSSLAPTQRQPFVGSLLPATLTFSSFLLHLEHHLARALSLPRCPLSVPPHFLHRRFYTFEQRTPRDVLYARLPEIPAAIRAIRKAKLVVPSDRHRPGRAV